MKYSDEKRFVRIYDQSGWTSSHYIWLDCETGVQYLVITSGQGAGVTPLIGPDGKPLLYEDTADREDREDDDSET